MLDQMFTAENFRRVFDIENRKGLDLATRFFPNLEIHTLAVRDKVDAIRKLRSKEASIKPDVFNFQIASLKTELAALKSEKSAAIDKSLERVSFNVLKPDFKITLDQKIGPKGKIIYCIDKSPETFFIVKQLQRNLNKLYGVKQSNRHDLACQIRDTVGSRFPYELVRTDISSFYESIETKELIEKLDRDQLLSPSSKKYIKQILDSYRKMAQTSNGIPRGIGISAYLAELHLRKIDKKIQSIDGITLYCRYVDDIVAIFARPPAGQSLGSYKDRIIEILSENNLSQNVRKTQEFNLASASRAKFEYLGYRFFLEKKICRISPSAAKIRKYKVRINKAFEDYERRSHVGSRRAYRDLVSRVKFLTGNARLVNSKSSAVTGVYYNNSIVTECSSFELLDKFLKRRIAGIRRPNLRARLKKYKFKEGFIERRFHNFSAKELATIVRVWKHG